MNVGIIVTLVSVVTITTVITAGKVGTIVKVGNIVTLISANIDSYYTFDSNDKKGQ